MIGRTVKAWLTVTIVLLAAVPARATEWPGHGLFTVSSSVIHGGLKACEIQLSPKTERTTFSLVWVDVVGRAPLIIGYLSDDARLAQAEQVAVMIDGTEIFSFRPLSHSNIAESTSVYGPVRDATHAWDAMRQAAANATWLTVKAGETAARVPAKGLRETLADFAECRRRRSL